jgi:hypothetical protein
MKEHPSWQRPKKEKIRRFLVCLLMFLLVLLSCSVFLIGGKALLPSAATTNDQTKKQKNLLGEAVKIKKCEALSGGHYLSLLFKWKK